MAVRNQLPEGVGKKIVEALKRQAEADITPIKDSNNTISNTLPLNENVEEVKFDSVINDEPALNDYIIEEEVSPVENSFVQEEISEPQSTITEIMHEEKPVSKTPVFNFSEQTIVKKDKVKNVSADVNINIPSNVAILKNLISTLPVGVSKQTGAQIIRQTLEAMGLPMNSVLKEAQEIQEELNNSTRECMAKIQEYKNNIIQLEQSVQEYQKNVTQINDLVSLFLLTDKK